MSMGAVDAQPMSARARPSLAPDVRADDAAFDEFFRAHYAHAVRLAHMLSGSNAYAEDLAQDAFIRVRKQFHRVDNPGGYLRAVTVNLCKNWHRSRGRESDRLRRHGLPSPETSLEHDELLGSLEQLPYRQRAVLVLRYWVDLSESDIAATLGCRPGTVKSLHARALAHLRKDLPS